ncbi:hypothetical protein GCM10010199_36160 [Dactylosporangium roseum]
MAEETPQGTPAAGDPADDPADDPGQGAAQSPSGGSIPKRPGRKPRPDRARRRAVRAHAAQAGVAYSVAARQVKAARLRAGETLGNAGRTVYPAWIGHGERWTIVSREARGAEVKLADARRAGRLPGGRAEHLVERFPPGLDDAFYAGERRAELLALVYLVVADDSPGLVPAALDLAWTAELGEETAVDAVCADLDRAARRVLDGGVAERWRRIEAALVKAQHDREWRVRYEADLLVLAYRAFVTPGEDAAGEPFVVRAPWAGVRQVLDALLVIADDGHAPGTRVRTVGSSPRAEGTVVGARWGPGGPPTGYEVRIDGEAATRTCKPEEIVILPGQESDAPALVL